MATKFVYLFSEGNGKMKELLGGKGANLAEMTSLGMPVPQGFTITTEACTQYYEDGEKINDEIQAQIMEYIVKMEEITGKKFGDLDNPLLVSVRSGARASMPGMMDTILNLGLNEDVVDVIAKKSNNPRWAWDCYRRFIQMYSDVVMEVGKKYFEELIDKMKEQRGVTQDVELTADDLKELASQFKAEYKSKIGSDFPSDPKEQLMGAIKAVFRSWNNPRAIVYRRMNDIPGSWGTAVNVQSMAFGNMGDDCGTGVAFTRNPATGEKKLMGEFLTNAQGEDVVAGVRTPMPIQEMADKFPEAFAQFQDVCQRLENHYRDMQDMEFTVENGKLYMLQTRNGKRTAAAALKIACDLVDEGMISEQEAVAMIDPRNLDTLLHPQFDPAALKKAAPVATALPASPGAACGKIVFTADDAKAWAERGEKVCLVRLETSPEDIEGMVASQGILTVRGGMTSHAAVVARGMGTCCVSGCGAIKMDEANKQFELDGRTYREGDWISLDGSTGNIYGEAIPTVDASISGEFGRIMAWADKFRQLKVRTNADNPRDTAQAVKFGAEGIGLCRTEHMFFEADRIPAIREMICSDTVEQREKALAKLEPMQQGDFEAMYEALEGRPMTIRFLDPPLHEFVPTEEADIAQLAQDMGKSVADIKAIIASLHEFNPMMGHRGCRLAVTYPEIAAMQTRAVIKAALNVQAKHPDWKMVPEIMIPLVGEVKELAFVKNVVVKVADQLIADAGSDMKYLVGTMIEIPRAALTADEIAKEAQFFSFGTNDLTQMTFGFSRDDAGKFLESYYSSKIYESDPFARLDQNGVGRLVEMACKLGRQTRPDLKLGICGEHGGDPSSVEFCHNTGLDYVSCSPFRVPIARLAAAQAAIKNPRA
ncbi:Pyruvate%2C phosphate dikinase [uncultured Flavonifractor sp.]|uniref:Pyruvate, phosphate dikinase n=1 Tax=Flintibacter hominis TaxID=2763048 RepID=A0A8J6J6G0_9FIRM|nr:MULTISPECIES: pyruvate, phosphate dikinase [Eubacteriales]MBS5591116.1 pyruvate, phosphate dikinase [Clostridiales bacterium]SCH54003.1 Pyruvate%2C phosphate dikinase [uncultured Clostridium sp.]SCI37814.1 Pyruvate%2C phosphate dikinase [uncultured Flavonifractor sp.]MBC5721410.1 pyruvate, phosphate dikinase [Flintibacter hominis]MCH1980329.1 pyruvate, phosphate dikinase [Lawsonibacter sp. OA9]